MTRAQARAVVLAVIDEVVTESMCEVVALVALSVLPDLGPVAALREFMRRLLTGDRPVREAWAEAVERAAAAGVDVRKVVN